MKLEFDERVLNRFSKYRELKDYSEALLEASLNYKEENTKLKKQAESDANLIASLNRYIEALEGRDTERVKLINELQGYLTAYRKTIDGLLKRPADEVKASEANDDNQNQTPE